MVAFDRVGCVDQWPGFLRELEEGGQLLPVLLPGLDGSSVLPAPGLFQLDQVGFGFFSSGSFVDGLEIRHERLAVLPGNVLQLLADLVDDATLHQCLGKDGVDRIYRRIDFQCCKLLR